jgi:hypothetical protein
LAHHAEILPLFRQTVLGLFLSVLAPQSNGIPEHEQSHMALANRSSLQRLNALKEDIHQTVI